MMHALHFGNVTFRVISGEKTKLASRVNDFVLMKNDNSLHFYESMRNYLPREILEVGLFEGGSLVYFDKLFKPRTLVGVDRRPGPLAALDEYVRERPHMKIYLSRFQDKEGVLRAARENFPHGIDLVVDDASHRYAETKAMFAMLYPMLRVGGHYVIERWNVFCASGSGDSSVEGAVKEADAVGEPGADRFVHELIGMAAKSPALAFVKIHSDIVCIQKGAARRPRYTKSR